jgi:hypothetical protein
MAVAPAEAEARLDAYIDAHIEGWMDELARLCGQPSASARHEGIDACAGLVATLLRARGLVAEVSPTDGGRGLLAGAIQNGSLVHHLGPTIHP